MRLPWPQVAMPGGKEAHGRELLSALEASGAYVCSALLEHEEQAVRDELYCTAGCTCAAGDCEPIPWPPSAMSGANDAYGCEAFAPLEEGGAVAHAALLKHEEQAVTYALQCTAV